MGLFLREFMLTSRRLFFPRFQRKLADSMAGLPLVPQQTDIIDKSDRAAKGQDHPASRQFSN